MSNYHKLKSSTQILYLDLNNLFRCYISQKLFCRDMNMLTSGFMINYEKNGNSAYVLPFGTDYQEYLKPLQKNQ